MEKQILSFNKNLKVAASKTKAKIVIWLIGPSLWTRAPAKYKFLTREVESVCREQERGEPFRSQVPRSEGEVRFLCSREKKGHWAHQ